MCSQQVYTYVCISRIQYLTSDTLTFANMCAQLYSRKDTPLGPPVNRRGMYYNALPKDVLVHIHNLKAQERLDRKRRRAQPTSSFVQLAPGCIVDAKNAPNQFTQVNPNRAIICGGLKPDAIHDLVLMHHQSTYERIVLQTIGGKAPIDNLLLSTKNTFQEFQCILQCVVTDYYKTEMKGSCDFHVWDWHFVIDVHQWTLPTLPLAAMLALTGMTQHASRIVANTGIADVVVNMVRRDPQHSDILKRYCQLQCDAHPPQVLAWPSWDRFNTEEPEWYQEVPHEVLTVMDNVDTVATLINYERIDARHLDDVIRNVEEFYFKTDMSLNLFLQVADNTTCYTEEFVSRWMQQQLLYGRTLGCLSMLKPCHRILVQVFQVHPWMITQFMEPPQEVFCRIAFAATPYTCIEFFKPRSNPWNLDPVLHALEWLILCKPGFKARMPGFILQHVERFGRRSRFIVTTQQNCEAETATEHEFEKAFTANTAAEFPEDLMRVNHDELGPDGDIHGWIVYDEWKPRKQWKDWMDIHVNQYRIEDHDKWDDDSSQMGENSSSEDS